MLYLATVLFALLPPLQVSPWLTNYNEAYRVYTHYNETKPMIIVFGADWCGPCKSLDTQFNKINQEQLHDRYICVKIDVDAPHNKYLINYANTTFPNAWPAGVRIPTIMIIGADRQGIHVGGFDVHGIVKFLGAVERERINRYKVEEKPVVREPVRAVPSYPVRQSYAPACPGGG